MVKRTVRWFLERFTKRQLVISGIVAGALLVLGFVGCAIAYHKREAVLAATIAKIKTRLADDYQLDLAIGKAYFSGVTTVTFEQVRVTPNDRDRLASIAEMSISIRVLPLLTGNVKFGRLRLHDMLVQLVRKDSISNYDFIFRERQTSTAGREDKPDDGTVNLAQAANRMLNNVLYKIPEDMELRNFEVTYRDDSLRQRIRVPQASIDGGRLNSAVFVDSSDAVWRVSGKLNPDRRQLYIKVHADGRQVALPLLKQKLGLKLTFDTIEANLREVFWTNNEFLHLKGEWAVKNLTLNHWRIAPKDVVVPDAHIDAEVIVGNNHLELARTSSITVKSLVVHPYIRYTVQPRETFAAGLETPEMEAQDLFDAFPDGLFETLDGIRVSGRLRYRLDAFLDPELPDSVRFESHMEQRDLRVNSWGNVNVPKLNTTFVYTPYENGEPVRDIVVGPENPDFVRLSDISPNLKNAILTTEDPSFFHHNGFVVEAIRSSIATNLKEKAFKRGGSTISMQLVKNVFLNRNKTMVRKLEEIIIVWLMESTRSVSKDRMFEVYLNIIEWGRNVYGIREAARYYFGKHPSELTIGESIYLASIVPRPKTGLYSFNWDGRLKYYMATYFNYIGNIMARRGLTPPDSTDNYGFYSVTLREALRPERPASADTLRLEEPPTDFETELKEVRGLLDRLFGGKKEENEP